MYLDLLGNQGLIHDMANDFCLVYMNLATCERGGFKNVLPKSYLQLNVNVNMIFEAKHKT